MNKLTAALAFAGAVWMIVVLSTGSLLLARLSSYPGVLAANWVQYRGIAPSCAMIWGFDLWLVFTSAMEWIAVGLGARAAVKHLVVKSRNRWLA